MSKPSRNQIYDAVIRKMVVQALAEREALFAAEHGEDSDEMLLDYLRQQADELEHTPWPKEIVGWQMISQRFGDWTQAVERAGLPPMTTPHTVTKFKLYREEENLQKRIYRANRAEKKAKSIQKSKERMIRQTQRTSGENLTRKSEANIPPDTDGEIL